MTTAAGPQLFSDCHTCFISGNAALAGATTGVGRTSSTITGAGALISTIGWETVTDAASASVGVVSTMAALCACSTGRRATPPARTTAIVRPKTAAEAPRPLICVPSVSYTHLRAHETPEH